LSIKNIFYNFFETKVEVEEKKYFFIFYFSPKKSRSRKLSIKNIFLFFLEKK